MGFVIRPHHDGSISKVRWGWVSPAGENLYWWHWNEQAAWPRIDSKGRLVYVPASTLLAIPTANKKSKRIHTQCSRKLEIGLRSAVEETFRAEIRVFTNELTALMRTDLSNLDAAAQETFERMVKDFSTSAQEMAQATHSHLKAATTEHLESTRTDLTQAVLQTLNSHQVKCQHCQRTVRYFQRTAQGLFCVECIAGFAEAAGAGRR